MHEIDSVFAAVLLTGVVQANIDSQVILARRRGADWQLAGIHAAEQAVGIGRAPRQSAASGPSSGSLQRAGEL